ncbi:MAG: hypothetical protein EAZ89_12345 [Bacteroidetes bacterium]|nr:MAG: hypothetical protein EAZ89_12345 [Bacteroidota bacterium]
MKDRQRVISIFIDRKTYEAGHVDITEKLYELIPADSVEGIKYVMPSATETGIYYTVVLVDKKEVEKGVMGFVGS